MRRLAIALVPLLLFACDREPVAPDSGVAPTLAASTEWVEFVYPYPADGWNWGPVPCLPGSPDAVAFGAVVIREHFVTTPDGRIRERWSNPGFSDDFRFVAAGETWFLKQYIRRGMIKWDADGNPISQHGVEANALFENRATGAVLNWPGKWHFSTNANGEPTAEFLRAACKVIH